MKITLVLLAMLVFSVGLVLAAKPDSTQQAGEVTPSGGHASVIIPAHAVEVAPGVFSLGITQDIDGRIVEGFMFIDYKKANAKPPWAGKGKGGGEKCFAFLAKGAGWKTTEQYVTGDRIDTTLTETSLNTWDQEVSFDIFGTRNASGTTDGADDTSPDGKNEVMFENLGATNTIAYTIVWGIFRGPPSQRELVEWDAVFNTAYLFGDAGPTDEVNLGNTSIMDYQDIATHEFGHSLGLGHPDDGCTEETMYRYADYGETKKRTLETGDVAGVNELYS